MRYPLVYSTPVTSSFIEGVSYFPQRSILIVTIRANQSNIPYEYHDVPFQIVGDFLSAKSQGQYFNEFIKGQYSERPLLLLRDG
jgi:hypothetical protein